MAIDIINNGKNGSLVDIEDVNQFVKEFESLIGDDLKKESYIKQGYKTVEKFDWKIISKGINQIYNS